MSGRQSFFLPQRLGLINLNYLKGQAYDGAGNIAVAAKGAAVLIA